MKSSTLKILVNKHTPLAVEAFSRLGEVVALDTREITREAVRDVDILIVRSETKVDSALLEGSSVRFVGTVTIGTDHVDTGYLASKGIRFASAPGSNANSVAEYVAAALLVWSERSGMRLRETTLGVVGVGNVGSKVAKVAQLLGMNVLLNDPPKARASDDASYLSLDALMDADVITLHVPLTKSGPDSTHHLFDSRRIGSMKPGAVLINTSRGAVVETGSLRAALSSKHLSAAILDVWENEPAIDVELLGQVMLGTPHIAGYSLDGKLNALRMVHEDVCRFLDLPPEWNTEAMNRFADDTAIMVSADGADEEKVLRDVVRQAYDIGYDDRLLRTLTTLPVSERGNSFSRLRAEYRVRREFPNRVVHVSPIHKHTRDVLCSLGFAIAHVNIIR